MKTENKKIHGIVKELMSNALNAGAKDVNVDISREENKTTIVVKDNGKGMNEKTLQLVHEVLNQPRRDELEDYYGGLAGNSMTASGLNIVGMLVDEAKIDSNLGKGTDVKVIRYRK